MILESHSQAGQDLFAYDASDRKRKGTFLDIGCNDAVFHSNTYALEQIGWRGLLVDIAPFDMSKRKSPFVLADASKVCPAIQGFMADHNWFIDYLSLDVDEWTYQALIALPLGLCRFGCITVEHDLYLRGPGPQEAIRKTLMGHGYTLACGDVVAPGYGVFEDWFVDPNYHEGAIRKH